MGLSIFDERYAENVSVYIDASNTTVAQALTSPDGQTRRVDVLTATNSDSIAHTLEISFSIGPGEFVLGQVLLPAGAGTLAVPSVDVLAGLPAPYSAGIVVATQVFLHARVTVAVTGAFEVTAVGMGGIL